MTAVILTAPDVTAGVGAPDEWVPPSLTDDTVPYRCQVAVAEVLPTFRYLGELLQAVVQDGRWEDLDGSGGCTVTVSIDDVSVDLLTEDHEVWGALGATGRVALVDRELHVLVDGKVVGCYAPKGHASIAGDAMTVTLVSLPDAYFRVRTLGRVPYDHLGGVGTFPDDVDFADLPGVFWTGDGDPDTDPTDIKWVPGPRDTRALAIKGDAWSGDPARLVVQAQMTTTERTTYSNIVRAAAFMRLPDIGDSRDGQLLMTVERREVDGSERSWPTPGQAWPDEMVALVDESRTTGDWSTDPVTAAALAKRGPYDSVFVVEVYPVAPDTWTYIDELRVFRRDTLGTGVARDLVGHLVVLCRDAQEPSTWNLPVVRGADCGWSEVGVWRREEFRPLVDAISAVCERKYGPARPWVDTQRRLRCEAVRGVDRRWQMTIGPDDIVSWEAWEHDSGAQASQVVAETDMGSGYWRHVSVATDTTRTDGHVIEHIARAPNDLGLRQLDSWAENELDRLSQVQETMTVWVRPSLGWWVGVGDRVRLVLPAGRVRFDRDVRVWRKAWHDRRRLVALSVGVHEDEA